MKKNIIIKEALEKRISLNENKKTTLHESVKIRRTEPSADGNYMILITSDLPDSMARDKETAGMGYHLKLTKGNENVFRNRFNFQQPIYWKGSNGKFGWGYKIINEMDPNTVNGLLNNLKTLVADYNDKRKIDFDLSTQTLTQDQIQMINKIADAVQSAADANPGTTTERNLDKYLDELQNAIENDDVFNFLIDTFEKAKNFQKVNLSFYKYSFLNSLIIRFADPHATYAAPKTIWDAKGYRIKEEFKNGIIIQKKGSGKDTTWENANWFKTHPVEWAEYKKRANLSEDLTVEQFLKDGGRQAAYSLAAFAIDQRYITNTYGGFTTSTTYTDTMIEPIPGRDQDPLDSNELEVQEDPTENLDIREKINKIFDAVSKIAEKDQVSTLGIKRVDGDVNSLNSLLNKVSYQKILTKYDFMLNDKSATSKNEELLRAYAEAISHIVRKHFGLPAESSKYNIASMGVDKEGLKKRSQAILNIANYFIDDIEKALSGENSLAEVRKAVKKIISENFKF